MPGRGFKRRTSRAMASCVSAPVAQLDRVSVFETEGWEFKPLRARQLEPCDNADLPCDGASRGNLSPGARVDHEKC